MVKGKIIEDGGFIGGGSDVSVDKVNKLKVLGDCSLTDKVSQWQCLYYSCQIQSVMLPMQILLS